MTIGLKDVLTVATLLLLACIGQALALQIVAQPHEISRPTPQSHDNGDDALLAIDVGRLNVMLNQIAILLHQPAEQYAPLQQEDSSEALQPALSRVAERFQHLLPLACRSGHVPAGSCTAPYSRVRIGVDGPSQILDDLYRHIRPVWSALCVGHRKMCRLE